jgi:hypothetical protein
MYLLLILSFGSFIKILFPIQGYLIPTDTMILYRYLQEIDSKDSGKKIIKE